MSEPGAGNQSLTSVSRALQVLVMLERVEGLRVVDVSRALGVAGSTAHRLLTCLREEGFLQQQQNSRRYVAGPELLRLSRFFSAQHTLERAARPHLERLCQEVKETVNLQIRIGAEVLCVDSVVESHHVLHVSKITDQRTLAPVAATGKVLLSALPEDELAEVLNGSEEWAKRATAPDLERLRRELKVVRERGYAINPGDRVAGVHAVAVPVFDLDRSMIAAISVAAPSVRLPNDRISGLVKELRVTSAAITSAYFASAA